MECLCIYSPGSYSGLLQIVVWRARLHKSNHKRCIQIPRLHCTDSYRHAAASGIYCHCRLSPTNANRQASAHSYLTDSTAVNQHPNDRHARIQVRDSSRDIIVNRTTRTYRCLCAPIYIVNHPYGNRGSSVELVPCSRSTRHSLLDQHLQPLHPYPSRKLPFSQQRDDDSSRLGTTIWQFRIGRSGSNLPRCTALLSCRRHRILYILSPATSVEPS